MNERTGGIRDRGADRREMDISAQEKRLKCSTTCVCMQKNEKEKKGRKRGRAQLEPILLLPWAQTIAQGDLGSWIFGSARE
jgi:hypothetical protein